MSTIVTRAGKGSPLTHTEVDSNFTNLNTDKVETSGGTLTNPTINGTVTTTGLNFDSNTFVIDATNNRVGVGTASPSERLEVSGNLAFSTDATIRRTTSDGADNSYVAVTGGGALSTARGSQIVSFGNEHATDAGKLNLWSGNVANSEVVLNAYSSSSIIKMLTNNTERMRITSAGNVGIGTSSPAIKLDVVGTRQSATIKSIANLTDSQSFAIDVGAGLGFIGKYNTAGDTAHYGLLGGRKENATDGNYAGYLVFETRPNGSNLTERMRIDSSGNLLVGKTSATANGGDIQVSKGITFPATQSAQSDANTLDDYEEGTFTPTITGSTTAGTGTYGAQEGYYTKIGNLVTVTIYILVSAHTGTGNVRISGLPFSSPQNAGVAIGRLSALSLTAGYIATMYTAGTNIVIEQYPTGGGSSIAVPMDAVWSTNITVTYKV